mmetsp:Transcript_24736/g.53952  ORF Transcript_24736/g.53952 Transcript_24736/m.53952 type:complete len:375 (+) Transcript_24736:90-1214(+)
MHTPTNETTGNAAGLDHKTRMAVDATAGALAGCIARFLVGPLDVIKIRFQVQLEPIKNPSAAHQASKYTGFTQALATILREEGIQGLWRGTVPGLLLTVPYTAVQFVALQQFKDTAAKLGLTSNSNVSPLLSFASGAFAGAMGTVASYPFDLLRTTLAAQGEPKVYRGMLDASRDIVQRQGFAGLYRGMGVTLVEIIPYAALQFGLYDSFKVASNLAKRQYARSLGIDEESMAYDTRFAHFVCGLMAGLCAKLATHPLDVAKKRFQVAGLQRSLRYGARVEQGFAFKSLRQGLVDIYRKEGMSGLWKGSVPSIIKAAPSAAITFSAYEVVLTWVLALATSTSSQQQQQGGVPGKTLPVVASAEDVKQGKKGRAT